LSRASFSDLSGSNRDVCSAPVNGHRQLDQSRPKRADSVEKVLSGVDQFSGALGATTRRRPRSFSTYHSSLPIGLYVSVCAAISICAALLLPDKTNKDIAHEVHYGNA